MPKKKSPPPSRLDTLQKELAELKSVISRLEKDISRQLPPPRKLKRRARTSARAQPAPPEQPVAAGTTPISPVPTSAPIAPPAEPVPTGTDLNDPKNFGLLPPVADLDRGSLSTEAHRTRLASHLRFTMEVLQKSGVPPAIWREWRSFEKQVRQQLSGLLNPAEGTAEDTAGSTETPATDPTPPPPEQSAS